VGRATPCCLPNENNDFLTRLPLQLAGSSLRDAEPCRAHRGIILAFVLGPQLSSDLAGLDFALLYNAIHD